MNCVKPTNMVCYVYEDGKRRLITEQAALSRDWADSIVYDALTRRFLRRFDSLPLDLMTIPCGRCLLCRQRRGFEIGIRARCEAACYGEQDSCFITLTVDDESMPRVFPGEMLRHEPWQLFAKRLRKRIGSFRFLMCGEYGDNTKRPHYHAIIFGHDFLDCEYNSDGSWCPSRVLQDCWPYGHVQVSRLNDNRIMYVAGYVLKPGLDDISHSDAVRIERSTGYKPRNYVKWSRRPGLGSAWIERFMDSVYRPSGKHFYKDSFGCAHELDRVLSSVIWNGKLVPFACRFFDDRFALHNPRLYDKLKAFRKEVGSLSGTVMRSGALMESELIGLKNKLEVLARRVASRKRDLS